MKYTQTLLKTSKENPKDETARNAQLLIKGGFITKNMAGVYAYLPLGLRVLNNISQIVRDAMDKVGSELLLTGLCAQEYYKTTGRWDTIDVLYRVPTNHGDDIA
ncbi:MAG TPA: prolyl-tRNA synthetase, partial [Candidatus Gracilibacteria bacterium]